MARTAPARWAAALRLHQLEGFYYVGLHEGFTRAAEAMPYSITEPALHQQVRKLEGVLGVALLVRAPGRRMVLTPEGRALHDFVRSYFEQLPAVLRALRAGDGGKLVVGSEPLYVEALGAEVMGPVQRAAPGAVLHLVEQDLPELAAGLTRGELDVAVSGEGALPRGLRFEPLGALGLRLLVPAGHPLAARRGALRAPHLAGERYVVYQAGTAPRAYTERVLARAGIEVRPAAEASSAGALRALVQAGVGPAFVPALRGRAPARRREAGEGLVAFDVTALIEQVAELPRFGLVRRAAAPLGGLLQAFCQRARARLA